MSDSSNPAAEAPAPLACVLACSGCSHAGELADLTARRLEEIGAAKMSCLAGVGGRVKSIMNTVQRAPELLMVDGCPLECGANTLRLAGITEFKHLKLHELGVRERNNGELVAGAGERRAERTRRLHQLRSILNHELLGGATAPAVTRRGCGRQGFEAEVTKALERHTVFDLAMDVLVPPLSWVVLSAGVGLLASVGAVLWAGAPPLVTWPYLASCSFLAIYVLRGWMLSGTGVRASMISWSVALRSSTLDCSMRAWVRRASDRCASSAVHAQ